MNDAIGYALLGLGTGGLYALMTAGIVVVQRGAGVLNLAHGALLAWAAYSFHGVAEVWGLPVWLAAFAAVVSTALIGLIFHLLVMRPMRDGSALTRVMATLGLLIILQSALTLMYGTPVRTAPTVLPTGKVTLAGMPVGWDVFVRLGVVAAVLVALWALFRHTTIGLAATAVTENPRAAATFGWSPDLVAAGAWTLGAALAGLAGVLLAPLQMPLSAPNLMLLIVPVLAIGLLAGFRSLPAVFVASLVLAVVEVETQVQLITRHPAWRGVDRAIPLIVIVFYLAIRGRHIPDRGHVSERLPALGSGRIHWPALVLTVTAAICLVWYALPVDWVNALNANALWAILILSVVVLVGFTGQLSLAQLAFAGVAALIAGRLVAVHGWPLEAALALGILGTSALGVLFALPALRTRGLQLAVVTLGLGAAADAILFQRGYHTPPPPGSVAAALGELGQTEGTAVGHARLFGVRLDTVVAPRAFATLVVISFVVLAVAVANLRRGRAGRRLIAVRTNERAAAALGISVVGAKLYAFALSAAIAGFGGVLYAFYLYGSRGNIDYGGITFSPFSSILLIAFAVLGGVGWVSGAFAGAAWAAGTLGTRFGAWLGKLLTDVAAFARTMIVLLGAVVGFGVGAGAGSRRPRGAAPDAADGEAAGADEAAGTAGMDDAATPGADGRAGAGRPASARPAIRRLWPWAGAVVLAAVALGVSGWVLDWLTQLDRYVPLIGGVVLVAILATSGGGMAPGNAALASAVAARCTPPSRRAARAARERRRLAQLLAGPAGVEPAVAPGVPDAATVVAPAEPPAATTTTTTGGAAGAAAGARAARLAALAGGVGVIRPATLSIWGLTVRFGAVTAVDDVSLRVTPGQIVGLIGPNGAGKTTVIDAITGYTPARARQLTLGEHRLDRLPAHRRARRGVQRSFQNLELFEDLTVLENIEAASDPRDLRAYLTNLFWPRTSVLPPAARAAIEAFGLAGDLTRTVTELPYGRRRLLAIARAVAARPSVLLLDEPCAGLDEHESAEVAALLRRLADEWGLGILLNEHDMDVVMSVCDRVVVLDAGKTIAEGTPAQVRDDPMVQLAYLGEKVTVPPRRRAPAQRPLAERASEPGLAGEPVAPGAAR
ncbi:ATP-binding cassette domain-containing protein [Pseudofrankia sp. BMG5.36]|uniref:ABC transporter permease subunit n=1 Tax=Pseudofrankia sp. BMG5.36 TaxID=1834512 RepID=UPI0008DAB45E|nr:ATP-binding cassette domain-containing protein [Pseudofrankia sp. BMG5.36]OHV75182.1 ABC transporter [Pseudofrankia sp. BMG5.36]